LKLSKIATPGVASEVCSLAKIAGLRIVIPNVIGRQTSAANRALNLVPHATLATRPDFTTTSAGEIDFEYFMNDWYHLFLLIFHNFHIASTHDCIN
jgi:hypothetical protein